MLDVNALKSDEINAFSTKGGFGREGEKVSFSAVLAFLHTLVLTYKGIYIWSYRKQNILKKTNQQRATGLEELKFQISTF